MSIYTRTGDTGETSLFGGKRVLKSSSLVEAYGLIDELNSHIGFIASTIDVFDVLDFLHIIQSDLFTIGSFLAGFKNRKLDMLSKRVSDFEKRIDLMEKDLPELHTFILPGGTTLGSSIHIARSICRRAERQIVYVYQSKNEESSHINTDDFHTIIKYINRLSDFFFVLGRFVNHAAGVDEVVWKGTSDV
jgi:cob(I)alamin adenosyltransferase